MNERYTRCPDEECFNNAEIREIKGKKYTDCSECKQLIPLNEEFPKIATHSEKPNSSSLEIKKIKDWETRLLTECSSNPPDKTRLFSDRTIRFIQSLLTQARQDERERARNELSVGQMLIGLNQGEIWIQMPDSEGARFNLKLFENHILDFYKKYF